MTKTRYNAELLNIVIERDKCVLDITKYEVSNRDTIINFICGCGNEGTRSFHMLNIGAGAYCKVCTKKNRSIRTKNTNLERHGVENVAQIEIVQEKMKQTNLARHGFENAMQSKIIQEKTKQTNLKRYGSVAPAQNEIVQEKMKQTNLERHGFENAMQNAEIAEKQNKSGFSLKSFIFPNGNEIMVQGYEPIALQQLIDIGHKEEDIITSRIEVPEIWYDHDNKKHRYYCDIFVRSENLIIEIKSTWTYKKELDKNILKSQAAKNAGYKFEFWIIHKDYTIEVLT